MVENYINSLQIVNRQFQYNFLLLINQMKTSIPQRRSFPYLYPTAKEQTQPNH